MATATIAKKNLEQPDERMEFSNGMLGSVDLSGATVARAVFRPGWKWSRDVGPLMGAETCMQPHLAYVASGRLMVAMDDGEQTELGPGDAAFIPPGHDGWTVGNEECVLLEFPPPGQ